MILTHRSSTYLLRNRNPSALYLYSKSFIDLNDFFVGSVELILTIFNFDFSLKY